MAVAPAPVSAQLSSSGMLSTASRHPQVKMVDPSSVIPLDVDDDF